MMGGSAFKSMYCSFKGPEFNSSILDGQLSDSCNSKPGNLMPLFGIIGTVFMFLYPTQTHEHTKNRHKEIHKKNSPKKE